MGVGDFLFSVMYYTVDAPVTAFRNFVERQQSKNVFYYYHRQYPRVTPIEDCLEDDYVCIFEANEQYRRDRLVEEEILKILAKDLKVCLSSEGPNAKQKCQAVLADYEQASDNFGTKYAELGYHHSAIKCMNKQKDRMIKERKKAAEVEGAH